MLIRKLDIRDLRVIEHLILDPVPGINVIVGGNGDGKTSVLEAIYLAGRGRSFRHPAAGPMIRWGSDATTVVVGFSDDETTDRVSTLGVRRGRKEFACRIDGTELKRRSALAESFPVQWIGSQPQQLFERGPDVRRCFLDMGLFHVEHRYFPVLREFNRIHRQRNAALRVGDRLAAEIWKEPFAIAAEKLHAMRGPFLSQLMQRAGDILDFWQLGFDLTYVYKPGWQQDADLRTQLDAKIYGDLKLGFATIGPQRAEVEFRTSGGVSAEKTLSRGQQKMVVIALNLALIDEVVAAGSSAAILLIDDLGAELDLENQCKVIEEVGKRTVQAFIAAIGDTLPSNQAISKKVFHVEQGQLR